MKVCIAEKPSVAREIAFIIGAKSRKDGYFEGNGYQVTWTFGHLCTLKPPDAYRDEWKKWHLGELPMLPVKFETQVMKEKGVKKQFGVIKKLFRKASVVINCGDAGQEGELIQRWVMKEAGYKGKVQRLWISSLTSEAIREGFRNLRDAAHYDNLYYAGFSRAGGDWLLGMNATRLYTLKYGGYKQVLSVGRVQTPTLAMLVQRQKEIDNFKPEPYWELHTLYREVDFAYTKGRFEKKPDGENLLAQVQGQPFVITKVDKKKGKEYAPPLFDLTGLQVHANKRFNLSADQTLKIAQRLYEQKLITYPRTDTTYLPNDIYPKVPGILKKLGPYQQLVTPLLGTKLRKSAKVFNDKKVTDHHALIPTGTSGKLTGKDQQVYDAITRRFIAVFYPDCEVAKTTVIGASNEVEFKATGKVILKPGWREVLFPAGSKPKPAATATGKSNSDKPGKEPEVELPPFKVGEQGPHEPALLEKMTQPPRYYTEATLLRAMETAGKQTDDRELRDLMKANGIGRPSTRAAVIETLFRRRYITRVKKQLHATETGISLIDTIKNDLLKSVELTGQWEKQLRDIEAGAHSAGAFIADMKKMVTQLVSEVKQDTSSRRIAAPTGGYKSKGASSRKSGSSKTKKEPFGKAAMRRAGKALPVDKNAPITALPCPKCNRGKLLRGKAAYGCSRYTEGCAFRLPFVFRGKKLSDNQVRRLVTKGSTVNLKNFQTDAGKVDGKVVLHKDGTPVFEPKAAPLARPTKPAAPRCPRCKRGRVVKGRTAYGCTRHAEGCDWRFPFSEVRAKANGRQLTKAVVLEILGASGRRDL